MVAMLCRNRVADFARWKAVFDYHAQSHRAAGLHFRELGRDLLEPDNIFFLFEVASPLRGTRIESLAFHTRVVQFRPCGAV